MTQGPKREAERNPPCHSIALELGLKLEMELMYCENSVPSTIPKGVTAT